MDPIAIEEAELTIRECNPHTNDENDHCTGLSETSHHSCQNDEDNSEDNKNPAKYMSLWQRPAKFFHHLHHEWPRTHSIFFDVIIPLLIIVGVSSWLGKYLADLESGNEIDSNNAYLEAKYRVEIIQGRIENISGHIPIFCLDAYFRRNVSIPANGGIQNQINESLDVVNGLVYLNYPNINRTHAADNDEKINQLDMAEFMIACGKQVKNITSLLNDALQENEAVLEASGGMTFNWIRCQNNSNYIGNEFFNLQDNWFGNPSSVNSLKNQQLSVSNAWRQDQQKLSKIYFNELYDPINSTKGIPRADASRLALDYSIGNATGFSFCESNYPAAGWFWFTVMTTIGYGNATVATPGGRAMVFTLGFISIMMFAIFLSRAGIVVTSIFDDTVSRWSVSNTIFNSHYSVQVILWGSLYCLWMLLIAVYYQYWQESRLGEPFSLGDAYWFSYISSTTVGFGDFYIQSYVFFVDDFFAFSLLFLICFVLLANLLVKLTDIEFGFIHSQLDTLPDRLKKNRIRPSLCRRSGKNDGNDFHDNASAEINDNYDDNNDDFDENEKPNESRSNYSITTTDDIIKEE